MIIMHIMGGIGNQFFQYAFGRYLAHKHNTELKLDITECENCKDWHHNYYRLGEFNVQENFATLDEIKSMPIFDEKNYKSVDEFINAPDDIFLYGYFGKEKYFIEIRDILLREMTLKNPLGKNSAKWKEKILSSTCAVSLHIRHGDFLTPLIRKGSENHMSLDYCLDSLKELQRDFPNLTVFVFSDDIKWCKETLKLNVPTEFVEGCETDAEELYLMSICKHNIIYNSTFAWWGAWLNQNPDKKVFVPNYWEGTMQNSISVPIKENARPLVEFPPMLSIIVYVENNLPTINLSLSSILSQDFPDHEIILVDASTDGSGDFCRQFTSDKKVTLLTTNTSTDKFSAWNKALEVARGDYVLFLTAKEFLFNNVAKSLAQFYYDYLKKYVEPRGEYISYANYGEIYPNIICTTQFLEDDGNIPNKNLSLKVDSFMQNLNTFVELNVPVDQKLMALATKSLNNFVGTKFFKRKFINDNNIRFIGGGQPGNSELTFIVDTFMRTEKITFMPQVFLGRLK